MELKLTKGERRIVKRIRKKRRVSFEIRARVAFVLAALTLVLLNVGLLKGILGGGGAFAEYVEKNLDSIVVMCLVFVVWAALSVNAALLRKYDEALGRPELD